MEEQNNRQIQEKSHSLYIAQMGEELQFLWQDAHTVEDKELRDRKLRQFWELYRYYRKQKQYVNSI